MTFDLAAAAGEFGEELQQLLDAVLPYEEGTDPELRQVTVTAFRLAFAVELGTAKAREAKAIPLLHQGRKVAELFVQIRLVADSADRYPAVAKSKFELRINRHPLLRLDFDREMHTAPGSHGNVHAERGAITGLLARNNPDHSGELSKLHLPVGGVRPRSAISTPMGRVCARRGMAAPVPHGQSPLHGALTGPPSAHCDSACRPPGGIDVDKEDQLAVFAHPARRAAQRRHARPRRWWLLRAPTTRVGGTWRAANWLGNIGP